MNQAILTRKGPRKVQDIPEAVLTLLNQGKIETVNLTEWLAIDHLVLINHTYAKTGLSEEVLEPLTQAIRAQKKPTAMSTTKVVGTVLFEYYKDDNQYEKVLENLKSHPADAIRCYAPYLISLNEKWTIQEKFKQSKGLVADSHFGVREVVWMALRPEIEKQLDTSIDFLSHWAKSEDENIRRFTTEATRPRGVWCKHIDQLKETPAIALPILESLKSDPSKYVQDSVGNWLNDASKSQPDFVTELCERWQKESPTKATEKIVKRARRTLDKK